MKYVDFSLLTFAAFALMMGMILLMYIVAKPREGYTAPERLGVEAYSGGCMGKLLLIAVAGVFVAVGLAIGTIKL